MSPAWAWCVMVACWVVMPLIGFSVSTYLLRHSSDWWTDAKLLVCYFLLPEAMIGWLWTQAWRLGRTYEFDSWTIQALAFACSTAGSVLAVAVFFRERPAPPALVGLALVALGSYIVVAYR